MKLGPLLACLLVSWPAGAATFVVDSEVDAVDAVPGDGICASVADGCTLRAAVMETNALPGADVVDLPAGTYQLIIPGVGTGGDLDITDDVAILGSGAEATIIESLVGRVFDTDSAGSPDLTLVRLTVTGGCCPEEGGGIHGGEGKLTLAEVAVTANEAGDGGGIWSSGVLELVDTSVTDNLAALGYTPPPWRWSLP